MNLAVFEFSGQAVRSTSDGRFSVFDVLVAFGVADKNQNAQVVYKRVAASNSEVSTFCSNFKFPGRGQRETPVATEEGMYQLLMLCPGKRASEFRKWASQVLRERIEEERNGDLAYQRGRDRAVRIWKRQGKSDKEITQRLKSIEVRNHFTDTLKAHGVTGYGYAACTNAIYMELFGEDAQSIRRTRNVPAKCPAKDGLSLVESAANSLAEALADQDIEGNGIYGNYSCADASTRAAKKVRKALD